MLTKGNNCVTNEWLTIKLSKFVCADSDGEASIDYY